MSSAYQPKATTLACVLVRMVALVLIFDCSSSNYLLPSKITTKYKATSINEYFTPYACSIPSAPTCECKVISMYHTPHLVLRSSRSVSIGPSTHLPLANEHLCVPLFHYWIHLTQDPPHSSDVSPSWFPPVHYIPQPYH